MLRHVSKSTPFFALALLVLLPGCDWFGKKKSDTQTVSNDEVLYSIDGKSAVTVGQFEEYYNQVLASDPRLQSMAAFLPNLKKEVFDALANQELIVAWADKQNMFASDDFNKTLEQNMQNIKRMYAAKKFGDEKVGKITSTHAEIRDYYEQHKDPELIATAGGIKASGVQFDNKERATAFFNKVKTTPASFTQAAKMDQLTVREFAAVNKLSFDVDKSIKDALESKTTFPVVVMVQSADKKWWVVVGSSKQETKYRSFDEVKDAIAQAVEREKGMKQFGDEISKLKGTMTVEEKTEYFNQAQDAQQPNLEALLQQANIQQEAAPAQQVVQAA